MATVCSHLQQQHQLRVLDVHGDVKRRLVKLAERVHVSAVLDECLCDPVVSVLGRPVKSRHLQHVFGVDVSAALEKGRGHQASLAPRLVSSARGGPTRISSSTMTVCPSAAAMCSGVLSTLVRASLLTPALNRTSAVE